MEFEEKPPSNNKTFCCVPGCFSKAKRNRRLSFHMFPKEGKRKVLLPNKLGTSDKLDIRKAWALRLRMGKKPSDFMRVCSLHFTADDFKVVKTGVTSRINHLKWNAVPSVNLPDFSVPSRVPVPVRRKGPKKINIETESIQNIIVCHDQNDLRVDEQDVASTSGVKYTEDEKLGADALLSLCQKTLNGIQTNSQLKSTNEQLNTSTKLDETVCKLCLQITNEGNSKIIDAYSREAIRVVFRQQNWEDGDEQVMCNECSENLFAAFEFKVMCRNTEQLLMPYFFSKADGLLDLKEIYLKEKSDGWLSSLTEEDDVCRLCLQLPTCNFISLGDVQTEMIEKCIPEINFCTTSNPVICEGCYKSLVRHSVFVNACLDVQERVKCIDSGDKVQIKTEEIEIKSEPNYEDGDLNDETGTDNKIEFYQCKTEPTGGSPTSELATEPYSILYKQLTF